MLMVVLITNQIYLLSCCAVSPLRLSCSNAKLDIPHCIIDNPYYCFILHSGTLQLDWQPETGQDFISPALT